MRTRLFLRTTEFLWQEGHTAHATAEEAQEETMRMLGVYADFAENWMAMPVIQGEKTAGERFPGAVSTYAIEAMMQDRKALQAGTSHFLGQNFSKAQKIKFQDQTGAEQFAWTTSWGVSTRLVGGLIMTHSDDDGLVLPPKLAPKHVVLLPIYRSPEEKSQVLPYVESLKRELEAQDFADGKVRVQIDDRDIRGGEKNWHHIKRGVPLRAEIGPKDIAKNGVFLARRDTGEKAGVERSQFVASVGQRLTEIQSNLLTRALKLRQDNTRTIDTQGDFLAFFTPQSKNEDKPEIHGGFAMCHFSEGPELDELLKKHKVTIRCLPLDGAAEAGKCFLTGRASARRAVFAKAY
jgi:prolyl-tRNA synthetase